MPFHPDDIRAAAIRIAWQLQGDPEAQQKALARLAQLVEQEESRSTSSGDRESTE